jgi:uncharacterized protein YciI
MSSHPPALPVAAAAAIETAVVATTTRHFLLLEYTYVPNIVERRAPHRAAHLAHSDAWRARTASGTSADSTPPPPRIVFGGPTGDPCTGALLAFADATEADVRAFARADPYSAAGLIAKVDIRPWQCRVSRL